MILVILVILTFHLERTREDAPKQFHVVKDISRPGLFAPAAIQAPTPLQALNSAVTPMIKDNSEVVSGFEHMREILAMTKGEGRYFDALKPEQKENFLQVMKDESIPPNRMTRIINRLQLLVKLSRPGEAYEKFLDFIFDATKVSGEII